jgi:hypothetical protein
VKAKSALLATIVRIGATTRCGLVGLTYAETKDAHALRLRVSCRILEKSGRIRLPHSGFDQAEPLQTTLSNQINALLAEE